MMPPGINDPAVRQAVILYRRTGSFGYEAQEDAEREARGVKDFDERARISKKADVGQYMRSAKVSEAGSAAGAQTADDAHAEYEMLSQAREEQQMFDDARGIAGRFSPEGSDQGTFYEDSIGDSLAEFYGGAQASDTASSTTYTKLPSLETISPTPSVGMLPDDTVTPTPSVGVLAGYGR
jgi:hypothetical protein